MFEIFEGKTPSDSKVSPIIKKNINEERENVVDNQ